MFVFGRSLVALAFILSVGVAGAQVPLPSAPPISPDGGALAQTPGPVPSLNAPPTSASPQERAEWLARRLDATLAHPALSGATFGVAVLDLETNKLLYGRNDNALFNPASDVKLFTTAAALATLGPEFRWKTVVLADGAVTSGELKGNLVLKGGGDPSLVIEDLWRITSVLWSQGLRKIDGKLIIDDAYFDSVRVGPGFDQKQEDLPFRSPQGALSFNYNAVGILVRPGPTDGAPARIVVDPATPYIQIVNEVKTSAAQQTSLTVESTSDEAHTKLTVRGRIGLHDPGVTQQRRIAHPDLYTAHAFAEMMKRRGIKIAGGVERGLVTAGARVLTTHISDPLSVVVRDTNKRSNNFMAEQILKTLGAETTKAPGTWAAGVAAVQTYLEKIGVARSAYKMTNGSGLYDSNRFSPQQLVTLLRAAYRDFRYSADFIASLAVAGADGTIERRMTGALADRYVRAKTGTLNGVSCLAGYAGTQARAPLAFAIFMNGLSESATAQARAIQDQIAEALVSYLAVR